MREPSLYKWLLIENETNFGGGGEVGAVWVQHSLRTYGRGRAFPNCEQAWRALFWL